MRNLQILKIGLSGGIGSGKSTVCNIFSNLGSSVIDADQVAHDVLDQKNIQNQIIDHFGKAICTQSQNTRNINRKQLRHIIFNDLKQKRWLEHLLHPKICDRIRANMRSLAAPYVILAVPLLLETWDQCYLSYDRVLIVTSTEKHRIKRIQKRDALSKILISKILLQQASDKQRAQIADDFIDNNQDLPHLEKQVLALHQTYLELGRVIIRQDMR